MRNDSPPRFDYADYGEFKSQPLSGRDNLRKLARRLGIRNRYVRFFDAADKTLPLVDIGCGDGSFLCELEREGFQSLKGVEPSETYDFKYRRENIVHCYAKAFLAGCASASVGTFAAMDVLEHCAPDEIKVLLKELFRCLVPNGILVFRVPNAEAPLGLRNCFGDVSHRSFLTQESVTQLCFKTGLTIERVCGDPLCIPYTPRMLAGAFAWLTYKCYINSLRSCFLSGAGILTPNLICVLKKGSIGHK